MPKCQGSTALLNYNRTEDTTRTYKKSLFLAHSKQTVFLPLRVNDK